MSDTRAARWISKIPRQKSIASAGLIALLWLFLHPLASDQTSLLVLSLSLAALLVSSLRIMKVTVFLRKNLRVSVILSAVVVMTTLTTLIGSPELGTLRKGLVLYLVLLLGLVVGRVSGAHATLSGVLVGSTSVSLIGWFHSLDSLDILGFDPFYGASDFLGISGSQGYEFFSALVGVAVGLEILSRSTRIPAVVVLLTILSAVTLIWTGSLVGWVSLGAALLTWFFRIFFRSKNTRFALVAATIVITAAAASAFTLIVNRSLASAVFEALGKSDSVNARVLSWKYALQTIDPAGLWFGHGGSFWEVGSGERDQVSGLLALHGFGPFSHAHNTYVDLLIVFGIGGLALIAAALVYGIRGKRAAGRGLGPLPLVLLVALAVQGLGESIVLDRPIGWILMGLLVGAFSTTFAGFGGQKEKIHSLTLPPWLRQARADDPLSPPPRPCRLSWGTRGGVRGNLPLRSWASGCHSGGRYLTACSAED